MSVTQNTRMHSQYADVFCRDYHLHYTGAALLPESNRETIMKMRLALFYALTLFILTACGGGGTNDSRSVPTTPATNDDGSIVTTQFTAQFNTASPTTLPLPINLLFLGSEDLTLNLQPTGTFLDPTFAALSALDGFSTVAPWAAPFVGFEGATATIDPATVIPGSSVRVFEVTTVFGTIAPNGIIRELTSPADYVAVVSGGSSLAIIPTRPLKELTVYMAVLTDDIRDIAGTDATPDQTYFIAKRTDPLVDANGNSTDPLLDDATAQQLEGLRQIINAQESVAEAAGTPREDIVLSWTLTTQSITPVLSAIRSIVQPAPITTVFSGFTTAALGGPGIADIHIGIITLPYYLAAAAHPQDTAPLTEFWQAAPGAYLQGVLDLLPDLDLTSTHITVINPFPVVKDMQTVPVLLTVPNHIPKPAAGWPVVIFQHGITRNRADALAIADTLASIGYAVFSIDQPLHGIVPALDPPPVAALWVEGTPFGAVANERTFELDLSSNTTGAAGPDGITDASGTYTINLTSLLTFRDNLRQANVDLSVLASTIAAGISIDGDPNPDFDASTIQFVGQSFGSMVGIPFLAVETLVTNAVLSVPGGGIIGLLLGSDTFGPRILAGLAGLGIEPGSTNFNLFALAAQTVIDSADPINWAAPAAAFNSILLHEVIGDTVIPNFVATAPLSGTEPLIAAMGLSTITTTTFDPTGIRGAVRFVPPASHGSLLDPTSSPGAFFEMQGQMASMLATFGTTVVVTDPSVIVTE